jgi:acetolactate synthase-1/2/3 large subunit
MAEQTTGARIAEFLHAEEVTTIFSICDVSYNQVHKRAAELGMRVIGPRHEAAGVHMADGLARMTGRPQVVMAGMGPGVANLVPGVVCAAIENIPVVVIATQRTRSTLTAVRRGRFQFTPQIRLFEPVVKYAAVVDGAHRIDEVLQEAFRHATTGRPGPERWVRPCSPRRSGPRAQSRCDHRSQARGRCPRRPASSSRTA